MALFLWNIAVPFFGAGFVFSLVISGAGKHEGLTSDVIFKIAAVML